MPWRWRGAVGRRSEIDGLQEELRTLQEENALLALEGERRPVAERARELRACEAKQVQLQRRTRVNEWYLNQLKSQPRGPKMELAPGF